MNMFLCLLQLHDLRHCKDMPDTPYMHLPGALQSALHNQQPHAGYVLWDTGAVDNRPVALCGQQGPRAAHGGMRRPSRTQSRRSVRRSGSCTGAQRPAAPFVLAPPAPPATLPGADAFTAAPPGALPLAALTMRRHSPVASAARCPCSLAAGALSCHCSGGPGAPRQRTRWSMLVSRTALHGAQDTTTRCHCVVERAWAHLRVPVHQSK